METFNAYTIDKKEILVQINGRLKWGYRFLFKVMAILSTVEQLRETEKKWDGLFAMTVIGDVDLD